MSGPEIPPVPTDVELAEYWQMCAEVMKQFGPLHPAVLMIKGGISIQVAMRGEVERLREKCGEPVASPEEALEVFRHFLKMNQ